MPRTSSRLRTAILVVAAGLTGLAVGIAATVELTAPSQLYARFSYHARSTLGLPKNWAFVPGPEQAAGRTEKTCPPVEDTLVLIIGGQSNAANNVPVAYEADADVSVWFDGRCFPAADPLLGTSGTDGSIWSVLGDRIAAELNRPVLLIIVPVAESQFGDWMDSRSGYYAALSKRVSSARDTGYLPDMILWHHGETDAAANRDMAKLKKDVDALIDRLLNDIPQVPLYLFQATRCTGAYRVDGVPDVIEVMQKVADERPRVIKGMNTDVLGFDYRWDKCHFNSAGRRAIINRILPEVIPHLNAGSQTN